jgi:hypothetical protein
MVQLDDALDGLSPKNYREFRLLYNELLGYMERGETDKIQAVSDRLNHALKDSISIVTAIQRRLSNLERQKQAVQKLTLHEVFRHPKSTIAVTHPFPLPSAGVPSPASDESTSLPVESPLEAARRSQKEQQMDELLHRMAEYNSTHVAPSTPGQLTPDLSLNSTTKWVAEDVAEDAVQAPPDGVSLQGEFSDESLYIKREKITDVERSKRASDASLPKDGSARRRPQPPQNNNGSNRSERIWDYINNDQSSGGISHDL